ncbi:hypothetical protein JZ751_016062 [Albula glossodonta]|uniref:Interferon gamma n=1 Tax=Albula glossodonta TaxID=121402 RepID=A0A8T2NQH5_9TELE|nr:hypothetical protein JZ751_016062 [Albula glossodonta]
MNPLWGLALLCGFCLSSFELAASNHNISEEIKMLTDHFNVTADKTLFGNPIFLKNLDDHEKFEESEQKLLLLEILDVYERILSDMLNHTRDLDVKTSILSIKGRMEELRRRNFLSREKALKKRLQDLWAVKTNDEVVQRKAVRELLHVYQTVSKQLHRRSQRAAPRLRRHASQTRPE